MIQLNELGQEIFEKRYAFPGEKNWADRAKVIASTASMAEKDSDRASVEEKFYKAIGSGDLVPGGRIIYGAGRKFSGAGHNMLNCYVLNPQDTVKSIGKTIQDMYRISCAGGGIGFNFSNIRPQGDDIGQAKNNAPGSISVMKMLNEIGEHVKAGGGRRTALIAILNVTHPDLFEFLKVKLDKKQLNNFNISVAITDRFIEACQNNEDWYFTFGNKKYYTYQVTRNYEQCKDDYPSCDVIKVIGTSPEDALARAKEYYKKDYRDTFSHVKQVTIKAKDIWNTLWKNAVESGDPGIFNIDFTNRWTNVNYFEYMPATNPCGEQALPEYGNCCLANVNLANMVDEDGEFNWKRFARSVRAGVQFLDDILEINNFPIEECREVGLRSRRIGLGVMGYHYMLIKLGIRYGSEKCLEFTERLFMSMRDEAYLKSVYLSRDKGPFPAFDSKKFLDQEFAKSLPARIRMLIKEHGIRNAIILNTPPTGTTSMVMGVSSGIEPIFAAMYKRRFRDANVWKETIVIDPLFEQYYKEKKDLSVFAGAYDVTPEEHMKVQATIQKYFDSCISKTINLPASTKAEDFSEIALNYAEYLKGMTVYRQGSKGMEPLEHIPLTPENIEKYMGGEKEVAMADGTVCSLTGGGCG